MDGGFADAHSRAMIRAKAITSRFAGIAAREFFALPYTGITRERKMPQYISRIVVAAALTALANGFALTGQQLPEPKNWTGAEDHQNMMDQLGIKSLRPGRSPNESAPNYANYDES